ncbi:MAG: prephenate dehydrogenase [Anaerolineae bacterium]|jgi:prephenate dehydrogenase
MADRVTIIGLGCVGTSIGLALRREEPDLEVIGHDVERAHARQAHRMGAVSRTHWNLPAACEGADVVILALPLPAVRQTLEDVAPHLEEGCVLTDTATLKVPVLKWARRYLPDHVGFVTGVPIPGPTVEAGKLLVGPDAASADLFEGSVYCITPAADTEQYAVTTLAGLASRLGARPLFVDPVEYDGLRAGAGDLPALLAVALLQATVRSPGWRDMRKVAGYRFAAMTEPAASDPSGSSEVAMLNRENLVRRLDMLLEELGHIRQWLVENDEQALGDAYTSAAEGHLRWRNERAKGTWEKSAGLGEVSGVGEHIGRILFGGLVRRQPPGEEE